MTSSGMKRSAFHPINDSSTRFVCHIPMLISTKTGQNSFLNINNGIYQVLITNNIFRLFRMEIEHEISHH